MSDSLPDGLSADIDANAFPTPAIFDWLQEQGNISTDEMYNIFISCSSTITVKPMPMLNMLYISSVLILPCSCNQSNHI
jgi:hypothetical protein